MLAAGCGHAGGSSARGSDAHGSSPHRVAGCVRTPGHGFIDNEVAYVPRRLPPHPALVLAFHGLREPPSVLEQQTALDRIAAKYGFVVAYPSAQRASLHWQLTHGEGDEDIDYIRSFIAYATKHVCTDPRRVYLTGFSNGAGFAWRAGCELADRVAAIVPVSGSYSSQDPCPAGTPAMPTLEIHGRDPWTGTVARLVADTKARNGCTQAPVTRSVSRGVTRTRWPGCNLQRIYDRRLGHEWLTHGAFDTSLELWKFVRRFSAKG
jgi:polyhydroxybutyrate depolymerase